MELPNSLLGAEEVVPMFLVQVPVIEAESLQRSRLEEPVVGWEQRLVSRRAEVETRSENQQE